MFTESHNPADHSEHDPSRCDFARIWLTQQYIAGTHANIVKELSNKQIVAIGFTSAAYSMNEGLRTLYAEFGITLEQLFDFSEYLRQYLLKDRGLEKELAALDTAPSNPTLN